MERSGYRAKGPKEKISEEEKFEEAVLCRIRSLINGKKDPAKSICRERPVVIAIDGKSGSGKSTLAERIQRTLGGNLFHMDDFFLRPKQRTVARLLETGGNVDYERFGKVLLQIRQGLEIDYQPYDCKTQRLKEPVRIRPQRLNIVEGSYSLHPYFGDGYDLGIALDIDAGLQRKRIGIRNGEEMLRRFEEEWIPKENRYLGEFGIFEKADMIFKVCR